jgi:hypothetical protein
MIDTIQEWVRDSDQTLFLGLCTYSGITRFAKLALANAEPKADSYEGLSARDQGFVTAIAQALGSDETLTLRHIAILQYHLSEKPSWTTAEVPHRQALLNGLPPKVKAVFVEANDAPKDLSTVTAAAAAKTLVARFVANNQDAKRELESVKLAMANEVVNTTVQVMNGQSQLTTKTVPQLDIHSSASSTPPRREVRF